MSSLADIRVSDAAVMSTDQQSCLVAAFRALSNPHRLMIYHRLLQQQTDEFHSCLLQDLIDQCCLGAPTISHHIKALEQAQLIHVTRVGKYMRCALNTNMQALLQGFLVMPARVASVGTSARLNAT
jgi:DNA-binding transcriptional ArsR family regulator